MTDDFIIYRTHCKIEMIKALSSRTEEVNNVQKNIALFLTFQDVTN